MKNTLIACIVMWSLPVMVSAPVNAAPPVEWCHSGLAGFLRKEDGFRRKGAKMYVSANDEHAREHLIRELSFYSFWQIVDHPEEADYQIRLYVRREFVDHFVYIEITRPGESEVLYTSPVVEGISGDIRSVNVKQAAVQQLVHRELKEEFFE